jgi:hypothetical protein
MNNPILNAASLDAQRKQLARRIGDLGTRGGMPTGETLEQFAGVDTDFLALSDNARNRLLGTALAWSDEDRREVAWLRHANDDLAIAGYALCDSLGKRHGNGDERTVSMMARTLLHMGNVVKWEVAVTREAPHDFGKPHAILRSAMAAGRHRDVVRIRLADRYLECTLEGLYFRALLLARFSSGALNMKQIEILDAWILMWMPALKGVPEAPSAAALRVDLDSRDGLRRGVRPDVGPSLYLPPGPIEEAYRAIIREFHAGRMVPSDGITSTFRIEEHVAVLDMIRRGLRESTPALVTRAERREANVVVELHVGLAEVMGRGFCPSAPQPAALTLAARDGQRVDVARRESDRDTAENALYERRRRMVRVANVSETGFGIEGDELDCGSIAVDDVVALRLEAGSPLEICKVVRSVPAAIAGRVWIGVRRLSARARRIEVVQPSALSRREREQTLAFVPGEDASGRHDACLVSERAFAEGAALNAAVGECVYTFRFNRARERGRGWVLAGFEIVGVRGENDIAIA